MKKIIVALLLGLFCLINVQTQEGAKPVPSDSDLKTADPKIRSSWPCGGMTFSDEDTKLDALIAGTKEIQKELEWLRGELNQAMETMKEEERGNFNVQEVMSDYNQMDRLASRLLKKLEEARRSVRKKP